MAEYDSKETHTFTLNGIEMDDVELNGKTVEVEISDTFTITITRKTR